MINERISELGMSDIFHAICMVNALIDVFHIPVPKVENEDLAILGHTVNMMCNIYSFNLTSIIVLIEGIIIGKCQTDVNWDKLILSYREKLSYHQTTGTYN